MYDWNWNIVFQYKYVFIQGALLTLWLTLLVVVIGTALGVAVGLLRRSTVPALRWFAVMYIELFRALPILVLLIWIFYVVPILLPLTLSAFVAALITLSVNLSAFVAETVRAGIEAIPRNQFESGLTLGLKPYQIMFVIVLPQALRNMLPNLLGLYINQLKNSSLASVIAVNELLHLSNIVISNTYRPLEVYTTVAIAYTIIILPFALIVDRFEARLKQRAKVL